MLNNFSDSKKCFSYGAVVFALFLLCNPAIAFFDIFPDFIAYLILMSAVSFLAKRVPFFEEARIAFFKLALLSFARIPALFLSSFIRSSNTQDGDIIVLLSLVLSIIEALLAFSCISNLFAGISHIGLRSGNKSIIGENPTADNLKTLTYFFVAVKCIAPVIPEFSRLTSADSIGTLTTYSEGMRYYPVAFVVCQSLGYVIGFVWLAFFVRYLKAVCAEGNLYDTVMEFSSPEKEAQIEYKSKLEKTKSGLWFIIPAAFLSFDFTLDIFNDINILPGFIIGILLLFSILRLSTGKSKLTVLSLILGSVFTLSSLVCWIFGIRFFSKYTFVDLNLHSEVAKSYSTVKIMSIIELSLFVLFLVFFTLVLISFIKTHTGKSPCGTVNPFVAEENRTYTSYDRAYHRSLFVRAWVFFSLGALSGILRLLMVFVKAEREFSYGAFIPTIAPWLGVIQLAVSAVWGFFTYMFISTLAEDFTMKYAEAKRGILE